MLHISKHNTKPNYSHLPIKGKVAPQVTDELECRLHYPICSLMALHPFKGKELPDYSSKTIGTNNTKDGSLAAPTDYRLSLGCAHFP